MEFMARYAGSDAWQPTSGAAHDSGILVLHDLAELMELDDPDAYLDLTSHLPVIKAARKKLAEVEA